MRDSTREEGSVEFGLLAGSNAIGVGSRASATR